MKIIQMIIYNDVSPVVDSRVWPAAVTDALCMMRH